MKYKALQEVCEFKRGKTITKTEVTTGDIPVIAGGQTPSYYHNTANRTGETIAISSSGAYAGFVSYWTIPVFLSDSFSVHPNNSLLPKYVFYFLKNIQDKIYSMQKGAGVPHVNKSDVGNIPIPLPPIPVQEEIVRILDAFTQSQTELEKHLQTELELRKKQYQYYRDKLLSFEDIDGGGLVEWLEMQEVFDIKNGYTPSKANAQYWTNGTIPWFRMEDIRLNGRILSDSIQHITKEAVKGKLFPADSIIVATTATIGEHALITVDCLANQQFTFLSKKQTVGDKLDMKFFYYYMFIVDEWCKNHINASNFASVDMAAFRKLKIPLPPLEEQKRIVGILDRFDKLVNDISEGIPAEMEMRRKQYEYYRDRLLRFEAG